VPSGNSGATQQIYKKRPDSTGLMPETAGACDNQHELAAVDMKNQAHITVGAARVLPNSSVAMNRDPDMSG
jgi:hypothetical protein